MKSRVSETDVNKTTEPASKKTSKKKSASRHEQLEDVMEGSSLKKRNSRKEIDYPTFLVDFDHSVMKAMFWCSECPSKYAEVRNVKRHYVRCHTAPNEVTEKGVTNYSLASSTPGSTSSEIGGGELRNKVTKKSATKIPPASSSSGKTSSEISSGELILPYQSRQSTEYTCPYCPKTYTHRQSLRRHFEIHTGIPKYKCDQCHAKFYVKQDYDRHRQSYSHSHIKNYSCSSCGKCFSSGEYLQQHQQTHEGVFYRCPFCSAHFMYKRDARRHLARLHRHEMVEGKAFEPVLEKVNPEDVTTLEPKKKTSPRKTKSDAGRETPSKEKGNTRKPNSYNGQRNTKSTGSTSLNINVGNKQNNAEKTKTSDNRISEPNSFAKSSFSGGTSAQQESKLSKKNPAKGSAPADTPSKKSKKGSAKPLVEPSAMPMWSGSSDQDASTKKKSTNKRKQLDKDPLTVISDGDSRAGSPPVKSIKHFSRWQDQKSQEESSNISIQGDSDGHAKMFQKEISQSTRFKSPLPAGSGYQSEKNGSPYLSNSQPVDLFTKHTDGEFTLSANPPSFSDSESTLASRKKKKQKNMDSSKNELSEVQGTPSKKIKNDWQGLVSSTNELSEVQRTPSKKIKNDRQGLVSHAVLNDNDSQKSATSDEGDRTPKKKKPKENRGQAQESDNTVSHLMTEQETGSQKSGKTLPEHTETEQTPTTPRPKKRSLSDNDLGANNATTTETETDDLGSGDSSGRPKKKKKKRKDAEALGQRTPAGISDNLQSTETEDVSSVDFFTGDSPEKRHECIMCDRKFGKEAKFLKHLTQAHGIEVD